jgi:hypothetical protein
VQVPDVHDSEAFARAQAEPQAPQFVSDVRLVSQPFALFESQFPNPAVHDPI